MKMAREAGLKSKLEETDISEGCVDRVAYECVEKESLGGHFFEGDIWLIHLNPTHWFLHSVGEA